jgi:hypothetical protein
LKVVQERFAGLRERATRMFEREEVFRDLCEDYEACIAAAARLESSGLATEALRGQYVALQLRLERELLRCLEEHPEPVKP